MVRGNLHAVASSCLSNNMTKINIVVDINMSESRKAEIFAAVAAKRGNVADVLSVPYESIFKDFCPQWRYTQVDVLHEVIDMVFDKGTDAVWMALYTKAFRCMRSMRSKGRKMKLVDILSEVVYDYLQSMGENIKQFYRLKRMVEEKIARAYYANGAPDNGDDFKHSIID